MTTRLALRHANCKVPAPAGHDPDPACIHFQHRGGSGPHHATSDRKSAGWVGDARAPDAFGPEDPAGQHIWWIALSFRGPF